MKNTFKFTDKQKEEFLIDFDKVLDARHGKVGTPEREQFRKEAEAYCLKKGKCPRKLKKKLQKSLNINATKQGKSRSGWAEAFAKYAAEGEDEQMLPDFMDSEAEELI